MNLDILNENLSDVCTSQAPPYDHKKLSYGIFTGTSFFGYLNKQSGCLDVITYTASLHLKLEIPVRRLILRYGEFKAEKIHRSTNIHTKLYLHYTRSGLKGAYLGSQNLVCPVTPNLMVAVDERFYNELEAYFKFHWKNSEPFCLRNSESNKQQQQNN